MWPRYSQIGKPPISWQSKSRTRYYRMFASVDVLSPSEPTIVKNVNTTRRTRIHSLYHFMHSFFAPHAQSSFWTSHYRPAVCTRFAHRSMPGTGILAVASRMTWSEVHGQQSWQSETHFEIYRDEDIDMKILPCFAAMHDGPCFRDESSQCCHWDAYAGVTKEHTVPKCQIIEDKLKYSKLPTKILEDLGLYARMYV